jgi:hypothetical protein
MTATPPARAHPACCGYHRWQAHGPVTSACLVLIKMRPMFNLIRLRSPHAYGFKGQATAGRPRPWRGFDDGWQLAAGLRFLQGGRGTLVTAGPGGSCGQQALGIGRPGAWPPGHEGWGLTIMGVPAALWQA